jgi:hypothetical protein
LEGHNSVKPHLELLDTVANALCNTQDNMMRAEDWVMDQNFQENEPIGSGNAAEKETSELAPNRDIAMAGGRSRSNTDHRH